MFQEPIQNENTPNYYCFPCVWSRNHVSSANIYANLLAWRHGSWRIFSQTCFLNHFKLQNVVDFLTYLTPTTDLSTNAGASTFTLLWIFSNYKWQRQWPLFSSIPQCSKNTDTHSFPSEGDKTFALCEEHDIFREKI